VNLQFGLIGWEYPVDTVPVENGRIWGNLRYQAAGLFEADQASESRGLLKIGKEV